MDADRRVVILKAHRKELKKAIIDIRIHLRRNNKPHSPESEKRMRKFIKGVCDRALGIEP